MLYPSLYKTYSGGGDRRILKVAETRLVYTKAQLRSFRLSEFATVTAVQVLHLLCFTSKGADVPHSLITQRGAVQPSPA